MRKKAEQVDQDGREPGEWHENEIIA